MRQDGKREIPRPAPAQAGFTLIEVLLSMMILTIGMLSLLGVFGIAMAATQTSQEDMVAKEVANEAMESILTARETASITWDQIENVSGGSGTGIFLSGAQPVDGAGADGIYGTADDAAAGLQTLHLPGPDGIFGTSDDILIALGNYQRTILISPLYDSSGDLIESLRSVTITVSYNTSQYKLPKTYVLNTYISEFR